MIFICQLTLAARSRSGEIWRYFNGKPLQWACKLALLWGCKHDVVAGVAYAAEVNAKPKAAVPDWLTTLDPTVLDSVITEKAMTMMSDDVSNVIHIGKIMGFPQGKLQAYQSEHPFCVANQASCMFSDWRAKNSDRATVAEFVRLLRQAGIDDNRLKCVLLEEYRKPSGRKPEFV